MDPWVFIEIGFAGGATIERYFNVIEHFCSRRIKIIVLRIEARMDRKASPKLVENFVALCRGDGPSFEMGTPFF